MPSNLCVADATLVVSLRRKFPRHRVLHRSEYRKSYGGVHLHHWQVPFVFFNLYCGLRGYGRLQQGVSYAFPIQDVSNMEPDAEFFFF